MKGREEEGEGGKTTQEAVRRNGKRERWSERRSSPEC